MNEPVEGQSQEERLIKSKKRVQKHGEVFTPQWMVEKMLNVEGVKEACESIEATFLEPAAGEGAFLIEILKRKLAVVNRDYCSSLGQYENFALYVLTTLYGIELLEDNTQICVMNLYQVFFEDYKKTAASFDQRMKQAVLASARTIIAKNIIQGNFLTRQDSHGEPIVINEWKSLNQLSTARKTIKVIRTEYTLDEVYCNSTKEDGSTWKPSTVFVQLSLFDTVEEESTEDDKSETEHRYVPVNISNAYKEEMEVYE